MARLGNHVVLGAVVGNRILECPLTTFRRPDQSTYALFAKACKAAGGRNLVEELLDPYRALSNPAPDVAAALKMFQVRPWYSAEELAAIWPLVSLGIAGNERATRPTPEYLFKRLVPLLPRIRTWGNGYEFHWNGRWQQYFAVSSIAQLRRLRFTQTDFERVMYGH